MKELVDRWLDEASRLPEQPRAPQWWQALQALDVIKLPAAHRAIAGGIIADRIAWVFCAGYQAAISSLHADPGRIGALLVSEREGVERARLRWDDGEFRLTGEKNFVALCNHVEWLLVEALDEESQESLVFVERYSRGVVIETGARQQLLPDIDRGRVHLMNCQVRPDALVEGDIRDRLRGFRLTESLQVMRAGLGYLLRRAGETGGADEVRGELMRLLLLLQQRVESPVGYTEASIRTSRLLDGVSEWGHGQPWLADFERDRAVFGFASERFRSWLARGP